MALVEPFMIKSALDLAADETITLEPDTGESFLVKDIYIDGSNDEYIEVLIDKVSVGFFRVGKKLGNHLPFIVKRHTHDADSGKISTPTATHAACAATGAAYPSATDIYSGGKAIDDTIGFSQANVAQISETILGYMRRKGWFNGFPIAEGQKMTIKPYTGGKKIGNIVVIYEEWEAGDITKDMPNGTEATEYIFVNYGEPASNLISAGDYKIDVSNVPDIYPQFPFEEDVPAKNEITLLAILGSESLDWDVTDDYTQTKYFKLIRGRDFLFDEDRNGILFYQTVPSSPEARVYFGQGLSLIGGKSALDPREPFEFPVPLVFTPGEELACYINAGVGSVGAGEIDKGYAEIAFITKVKLI